MKIYFSFFIKTENIDRIEADEFILFSMSICVYERVLGIAIIRT
jgi:hypothetical protein